MKHNFKRVFALLLAVVMCMTCTLPVFASNGETTCPQAGVAAAHNKNNCTATEIDTVDPACETTGYTVYQCNGCGVYFMDDIIKALEGCVWGDEVVVTPATCTADGLKTKYCSTHNYTKETVIPATGHDWTDWIADGALCTAGGTTETKTCNNCGITETRDAEPQDHAWGAPVFNKVPTCVDAGEATYTCSECGLTKTVKVLPMSDGFAHDWETVGSVTGDCETESVNLLLCKKCGAEGQENLGFEPHDYSADVEEKLPTCYEGGYAAHKECSVCGEDEPGFEEYDKLAHVVNVFVSSVPSVCGTQGYETWKCANCDYTENKMDADWVGDHTYQITPLEATCTSYGHKFYFCTRCGHSETKDIVIPYAHHLASCEDHDACLAERNGVPCGMTADPNKSTAANCTTAGETVYVCSCGFEKSVPNTPVAGAGAHNYVEVVYEAANCQNGDGEIRWQCTFCNEYELNADGTVKSEVIELPAVDSEDYLDEDYHTVVIEIATPATCDGKTGLKIKFCKYCDVYPKTEFTYTVSHEPPVDADGEYVYIEDVAATCTVDGYKTYNCVYCGALQTITVPATGHTPAAEWTTVEEPDCTNDGLKVKYCTVCTDANGAYNVIATHEVIPKNGHNFVDDEAPVLNCENQSAELTETCTVCGTTQGTGVFSELTHEDLMRSENHVCLINGTAIENAEHHRPGKCNLVGLWSYICPNMSSDSNTFYVEDETTNLGHPTYNEDGTIDFLPEYIEVTGKYVAPTCVSLGKTLAWYCPYCDSVGGGEDIALADHDLETVDYKAPTCTEPGNIEYYVCKNLACAGYFIYDESGALVEITLQETVIDPIDHDYLEVVIPATCTTNGEIKDVCQNEGCDSVIVKGNTKASGHNYIKTDFAIVGCENIGYEHYECQNPQCVPEGEDDYGIREYITGYTRATGHAWSESVDCINGDEWTCANDASHNYTEEARGGHKNAAGEALTCEVNEAITDRVCADCGLTINPGDHSYVESHVDPTCKDYGYTLYVCITCQTYYTIEDDIKTLGGHPDWAITVDTDPAGCETDGLKTTYCALCEEVLNEEVIPATGHAFNTYNTIVPADVLVDGYAVANCDNGCGATDQKTLPALDGMKFSYSYDNAIKSGYAFVNTGKIAVAVDFTTQNVTLNSILLAFEFDAAVLEYVDAEWTCDDSVFVDCKIGYDNSLGKVSISAKVNTENEENKDVTLADGESGLAILYFNVKASAGYTLDAANNSSLGLTVVESGDQSSSVVDKNAEDVAVAVIYGTVNAPAISRLGDVNNDGAVTDADAVLVLDYVFGEGYSAQADINQDGEINLDDYQLIRQFVIATITYETLCAGEAA